MPQVPIHEIKPLGKGEAGTVALAKFEKGNQEYAVKTITSMDADAFFNSQRKEVQLYQELADEDWRKTHVVVPLAVNRVADEENVDRAQLIMPVFTEGSLKNIMAAKEIEVRETQKELPYLEYSEFEIFTINFFMALQNIHARGFTHTDIHPDQIMPKEGQFYLLDFSRTADMTKIYTEVENISHMFFFLLAGPNAMLHIYEDYPDEWATTTRSVAAEKKVKEQYGDEVVEMFNEWQAEAYKSNYKEVPYQKDYGIFVQKLLAAVEPHYLGQDTPTPTSPLVP